MSSASLTSELAAITERHGVDRVGFCGAEVFDDVRRDLYERKDAGLNADMQFTYRNPDRSTDPSQALPGAQSIVVGAKSTRRRSTEPQDESLGSAEIAEYVWEPHYAELRVALDDVADCLREHGWKAVVLIDDNALVDRAAAFRSGIGWWGKNSNILVPGVGSRFVLGSVVTDAALDHAEGPVDDQCGPCRRCIDACPTDAIVADGVLDANRCLAWLVQSPGVFPREFREALGARIYGCDDCQTSCPPNVLFDRRDDPQLTTGVSAVAVEDLLTLTDEALMERFGAWYIPRREARYLRRNALIVLGNIGDPTNPRVRDLIARYIDSDDEIERTHAAWAAHRMGFDDLTDGLADDLSVIVRDELDAIGATT